MPAVSLVPDDLSPFAPSISVDKALAMIEDAMALAARVAPCIMSADFEHGAAAKAILRGAVLRWNEAGTGAFQAQTVGPYGATVDTRQQRRSMFWPQEIEDLQALCRTDTEREGAFAVDTVGVPTLVHADTCALHFGGAYCSCGAVLTGLFPLYEV